MPTARRHGFSLFAALLGAVAVAGPGAGAAAPVEVQGTAIVEHAIGKLSLQNMALAKAGKMEEAVKLGTQAMQAEWKKMPAEDRKMISMMMKEMAVSEAEHRANMTKFGALSIEGDRATLTIRVEKKDANGSSTETHTERFQMEGGAWRYTKDR